MLPGRWSSQLWTTLSPSGASVLRWASPAHLGLQAPAGSSTPQIPIHLQCHPHQPSVNPLQTETFSWNTQLLLVMPQAIDPTQQQQQQQSHQQQVQSCLLLVSR